MREGRNLNELAAEILRVKAEKRDYIADTRALTFLAPGGTPSLSLQGVPGAFPLTKNATLQLAEHTGVPVRFFDRLAEKYPEELAVTLNAIMRKEPAGRLVRTLDGKARAFLSNAYRPIDNDVAAEVMVPMFMDRGMRIESCQLTADRLYIKAIFTDRQEPVGVGDFVQAGLVFSNSEVGGGAFSLQPLIYRLVCRNGAIMSSEDTALRVVHLGGRNDARGGVQEFLAADTKRVLDQGFMLRVRDTVKHMGSPEFLASQAKRIERAREDAIEKPLVEFMESITAKLTFNTEEQNGILRRLAEGGDLTRFGVANAITRHSQDVMDYDRATELERLGGVVFEMPKNTWESLALAA